MPIDWMSVLKVTAALAGAIAELPAHFDHRSIGRAIADLLHQITEKGD